MKRIMLRSCLALLCLTVGVRCSGSNPLQDDTDDAHPFAVAKSSSVSQDQTPVDETMLEAQAQSNNRFAVDLFHQMLEPDQNTFLSPYSVSAALAMAAAGAQGSIARQMREALGVTLEGDDFHAALNGLGRSISSHAAQTDGVELAVVNSAWAQQDWSFRAAYLDRIARYYGAGVNLVDFRGMPDRTRVLINDWVSEQTRERIQDLLPEGSVTPLTRLVLTNAIYFLGEWQYQFDPALTRERPFYLLTEVKVQVREPWGRFDGQVNEYDKLERVMVQVPMMTLYEHRGAALPWARQEHVQVLELPYRGDRLTMTLLLPDTGHYREFEATLTAERIDAAMAALRPTRLSPVQVPKFTFNTGSVSLRQGLQALGMQDAFEPGLADFSGIDGTRELYVCDVVHQAFIAVDEAGTEAAAATGATMPVVERPPHFIADRPFVFLIRDTQTNTILFIGRVLDPR